MGGGPALLSGVCYLESLEIYACPDAYRGFHLKQTCFAVVLTSMVKKCHDTRHDCLVLGLFHMFQRTLALSDNPFDPGSRNLAGNPLRIDQDSALMQLFCWKLAGLQAKQSQIEGLLFGPQRPGATAAKQGIIVIRGGKGTGKTTLASYVRHRILTEAVQPNGGWKCHETNFRAAEDPMRASAFSSMLDEVRKQIEAMAGQSGANVFLFLDDVPANRLISLINLFQDFNAHFQVYVVTTTDPNLDQAELDCSYAAKITIVETGNVNASDLLAYMTDRVKLFRSPPRIEFDNLSPIFPWVATAPQRLLGNQAPEQPLRLLNRKLSREVEQHHLTLLQKDGNVDVGTAVQTDLPQYMIP
jgi:hypothetical protein